MAKIHSHIANCLLTLTDTPLLGTNIGCLSDCPPPTPRLKRSTLVLVGTRGKKLPGSLLVGGFKPTNRTVEWVFF